MVSLVEGRSAMLCALLLCGGLLAHEHHKEHRPGCYGFPDRDFSPDNMVNICDPKSHCGDKGLGVKTADTAPDFTLTSLEGKAVSLHEMVQANKPVFMEFGSFTWPIYQGYVNATNALADKYGDRVAYLLIYVIEPHPKPPDISPYAGKPWRFKYSDFYQPRNYTQRVVNAGHISDAFKLDPRFTVLVDDLVPHNKSGNNPLWCQYGPAPNAAWLIGTDGKVALAQTWFEATQMDKAINKLIND